MITIPWTTGPASHDAGLAQVSRLELTRARDVPGFLIAALRLRRDALGSPGCSGISLRAAPLRRTFWTLSTWDDQRAISAFTRNDSHASVMRRYRGRMRSSDFHTWSPTDVQGRPDWVDAMRRFDEPIDGPQD